MPTARSGRPPFPCSMAFIVASATAVLSLFSRSGARFRAATLAATWSSATRSLPGTLASAKDASRRGAGCAIVLIG